MSSPFATGSFFSPSRSIGRSCFQSLFRAAPSRRGLAIGSMIPTRRSMPPVLFWRFVSAVAGLREIACFCGPARVAALNLPASLSARLNVQALGSFGVRLLGVDILNSRSRCPLPTRRWCR